MTILETAVIQTLAYANVFNFPLNKREVCQWLMSSSTPAVARIDAALKTLVEKNKVHRANSYYAISKKSLSVNRGQRRKYSREKYKRAKAHSRILSHIPTILLVGVSGSVAIENASESDDIDVYIICRKETVWMTRFFAVLATELFGQRRRPGTENWNNALCLNMFVDARAMMVMKKEQDVFAAHEVLYMQPVFDRGGVYAQFLMQNAWAKKFLATAYARKVQSSLRPSFDLAQDKRSGRAKFKVQSYATKAKHNFIYVHLEQILKRLQLWYMSSKRTNEVVTDRLIRFHPVDARKWVMRKYKVAIKGVRKG